MRRATRIGLILLGSTVAVMASTEQTRAMASDCFCCLCNYLFGS
ncbi:MAG: hypothetical protein ABI811_16815 [Acidobacteriota bacterium]